MLNMLRLAGLIGLCACAVMARPQDLEEEYVYDYDEDYVYECDPEEDGVFPDALQCDKYWKCEEGKATAHLCEDGLVLDPVQTSNRNKEICVLPSPENPAEGKLGTCDGRPLRQKPQPNGNCLRRNGYFVDPTNCNAYTFCSNGQSTNVTCSSGLVFDQKLGVCSWDSGEPREGCTVKQSNCPEKDPASPYQYARWAHETECGAFYVCINGEPRKSGCDKDLVYNEFEWKCDEPSKVYGECGDLGEYPYDEDLDAVVDA